MRVLIGLVCLALASSPALAGKPEWAGHDKQAEKHQHKDVKKAKGKDESEEKVRSARDDRHRDRAAHKRYFSAHEHDVIREYYAEHGAPGHKGGKVKDLPPGLQKKLASGGELPPGWQRKLERGDVVDHAVRAAAHPIPEQLANRLPYDATTEEIIRVQDRVIRMSKGEGTIIDVIDIADVMVGRGIRSE